MGFSAPANVVGPIHSGSGVSIGRRCRALSAIPNLKMAEIRFVDSTRW
jgi:hypothetical protein